VIEVGEDAPLSEEAFQDRLCVHSALDHLKGDLLREPLAAPLGHVNRAHPSRTDRLQNGVPIDLRRFGFVGGANFCGDAGVYESGALHETAGFAVGGQHFGDLRP
jgi:hypothetical protein